MFDYTPVEFITNHDDDNKVFAYYHCPHCGKRQMDYSAGHSYQLTEDYDDINTKCEDCSVEITLHSPFKCNYFVKEEGKLNYEKQ